MFNMRAVTLLAAIAIVMAKSIPNQANTLSRTPELNEASRANCDLPKAKRPSYCDSDEASPEAKSAIEPTPIDNKDDDKNNNNDKKVEDPSDNKSVSKMTPGVLSTVKPKGQESHNKCMDLLHSDFANRTPVQLWDCNLSEAQLFKFEADGSVKVHNSNFCLDAGSDPKNGDALYVWQCFPGIPAQMWNLTETGAIRHLASNLCVDRPGGHTTTGTRLQLWNCGDVVGSNPNQQWTVTPIY